MKSEIRLAYIKDAEQIAGVHVISWQTIYREQIPDDVLSNLSVAERAKNWVEWIKGGAIVWVIERSNKIIGFVSGCPTRDKDDNPELVLELSSIYLLPEFWFQGYGKNLCQEIFSYAIDKGFKQMTVWVLESNIQARRFYEKLGFYETGDIDTDHFGCSSLNVIRYKKDFLDVL